VIDFLGDVAAFFGDNWWGEAGIVSRTWEHIQISAFATATATAAALPPALVLGHTGRGAFAAVTTVNIGRAIPSFAIVAISLPFSIRLGLGLGYWPTFLALFALALPPIFTNTLTAIRQTDPAIVEAARGMGMTGRDVLLDIELPLATPLIIAGIRVSAVQVVATATLGALVGWGGLGRFIIDGFSQQDNVEVFVGGLLVAALAVITEVGFGWAERRVAPGGLRQSEGNEKRSVTAGVS
jgi:osmoprotectant transport system permease protein